MSSTGTRVVPTLTEVLDEQRLAKTASTLSTEAWRDSRPGDEELVPISLDWGDEPGDATPAAPGQDAEAAMTPWQLVQPRGADLPLDEAAFIDLAIDLAPLPSPAVQAAALEVSALSIDHPEMQAAAPLIEAAPEPLIPVSPADPAGPDLAPGPASADADAGAAAFVHAQAVAAAEAPLSTPEPVAGSSSQLAPEGSLPDSAANPLTPAADVDARSRPAEAPLPALASTEASTYSPVPTTVLNVLAAASGAPRTGASGFTGARPALDPGMHAVRQGGEHVPGLSEERLQAIIQQALDRLLRDELPSALVETLIRLSPQLSESLIESLKPSLHLHVMEALSAEPLVPPGRALD